MIRLVVVLSLVVAVVAGFVAAVLIVATTHVRAVPQPPFPGSP